MNNSTASSVHPFVQNSASVPVRNFYEPSSIGKHGQQFLENEEKQANFEGYPLQKNSKIAGNYSILESFKVHVALC